MAKRDKNQRSVIVVRREEGGGDGGHHGGAWKIAYADFVTAMMAFFLLMWLINATTDAQRVGLADYFAPTNVLSRGPSGAGEPFGGRTINSTATLAGETPPAMGERPMSPLPWSREDRQEEELDDPPAQPQPPRRFRSADAPESPGDAATPPPGLNGPVGNATGSASGSVAGNVTGTPAHLSAALARLAALDAPGAAAAPSTGPAAEASAAPPGNPASGASPVPGQAQPAAPLPVLASAATAAVPNRTGLNPSGFEQTTAARPGHDPAAAAAAAREARARARAELAAAAEEIRNAIQSDPGLSELARQLLIEQTRDGLRIQLVDADGQPVFATGQAAPNQRGRALLLRVATVLARLPYGLDIAGHTDSAPFRGGADRSNWELSSERAGAARRVLIEAGIAEERLRAVAGRADRDLLTPDRPLDAANRRVSILVLMPPGAPQEAPAP